MTPNHTIHILFNSIIKIYGSSTVYLIKRENHELRCFYHLFQRNRARFFRRGADWRVFRIKGFHNSRAPFITIQMVTKKSSHQYISSIKSSAPNTNQTWVLVQTYPFPLLMQLLYYVQYLYYCRFTGFFGQVEILCVHFSIEVKAKKEFIRVFKDCTWVKCSLALFLTEIKISIIYSFLKIQRQS